MPTPACPFFHIWTGTSHCFVHLLGVRCSGCNFFVNCSVLEIFKTTRTLIVVHCTFLRCLLLFAKTNLPRSMFDAATFVPRSSCTRSSLSSVIFQTYQSLELASSTRKGDLTCAFTDFFVRNLVFCDFYLKILLIQSVILAASIPKANLLSHFTIIKYFQHTSLLSPLAPLLGQIDIYAHWVFCTNLLSQQLLFERFLATVLSLGEFISWIDKLLYYSIVVSWFDNFYFEFTAHSTLTFKSRSVLRHYRSQGMWCPSKFRLYSDCCIYGSKFLPPRWCRFYNYFPTATPSLVAKIGTNPRTRGFLLRFVAEIRGSVKKGELKTKIYSLFVRRRVWGRALSIFWNRMSSFRL